MKHRPFDPTIRLMKEMAEHWTLRADELDSIAHSLAVLRAAGKADLFNIIDKKLHDAVKQAQEASREK